MTPRIAVIAAVATDTRVIGLNNRLPWRLPADLRRFKKLTMGHCLVMGRRTYESIGRALPGRTTVVVTRTRGYTAPDCIVADSWEAAVAACKPEQWIFVVGGAALYLRALPLAQRLYLTEIRCHSRESTLFPDFEGDTYFPAFDVRAWKARRGRLHSAPGTGDVKFRFVTYERRTPAQAGVG